MTTSKFTLQMVASAPIGAHLIVRLQGLEKRPGQMRPRSGMLLLPLLLGIFGLFYLDGALDGDRGKDFMREQLNIPPDVTIDTLNRGKKQPVCYSNARWYYASAKLSPQQFSRYLAATSTRELWQPSPPSHFGEQRDQFNFSEDALQWRDLPPPPFHGSQQLVYKIAGEDIRSARAFCYHITPSTDLAAPSAHDLSMAYSVTACNAIQRNTTPSGGGRIKAALDFDKQRLVIEMHFDRRAAYCNNRVTNWVSERLGRSAR